MKRFKGLFQKIKSSATSSLGKKLIVSVISVCASLGLLAVGVYASVTNFTVDVSSFANLSFVFNEGMMTGVRYGDVVYDESDSRAGQSAVWGESQGEFSPQVLYTNREMTIDGNTYTEEVEPNITEIEAPVDFAQYSGTEVPDSIKIAYIFCYKLDSTAQQQAKLTLTYDDLVVDEKYSELVQATYKFAYASELDQLASAEDWTNLPDFDVDGIDFANGAELVVDADHSKVYIWAECEVSFTKTIRLSDLDWNFNINVQTTNDSYNLLRLENGCWMIDDVEDLQTFRDSVNSGVTNYNAEDTVVKLGADIDLSSVGEWQPIGTLDVPFVGQFEGDSKTISNLTTNPTGTAVGLFGYTSGARISNLTISDGTVAGSNYVGAFCGYATNTQILDCSTNITPQASDGVYADPFMANGNSANSNKLLYTLTINYVYTDGTQAATPYSRPLVYGSTYSIQSPEVDDVWPSVGLVSGTITGKTTHQVEYMAEGDLYIEGNVVYSTSEKLVLVKLDEGFDATTLIVPKSVTKIEEDAFRNNQTLTSIEIPKEVVEIGRNAFTGCLSNLVIAFEGFEEDWAKVGGLLANTDQLTVLTFWNYHIEDGVYYLTSDKADLVMFKNTTLTEFTVPSSVTKIYDNAFADENALQTLIITSSVTEIGENAFSGMSDSATIHFEGSETDWEDIGGNLANINCTVIFNSLG